MNQVRIRWNIAKENKLFWLNLVLIVASALICVWPGPGDLRLRIWGMVLQLVGVLTVWINLTGTARLFNKDNWHFLRNTYEWLRRLLVTPTNVAGAAALMRGRATARGRAKQRWPIKEDAPLEDRVKTLEENYKYIDADVDATYLEIDNRASELTQKIDKNFNQHETAITKLIANLERATVGNFAMLVFGVAWLAVGVVLGTLAPEIHKALTGHWSDVVGAFR